METSVLSQLLLLLAFCVLVVATLRRLRLPPIVGYLAVGMLLGPQGLNFVSNVGTTQVLSELGVVFLVFTLGLEFFPAAPGPRCGAKCSSSAARRSSSRWPC